MRSFALVIAVPILAALLAAAAAVPSAAAGQPALRATAYQRAIGGLSADDAHIAARARARRVLLNAAAEAWLRPLPVVRAAGVDEERLRALAAALFDGAVETARVDDAPDGPVGVTVELRTGRADLARRAGGLLADPRHLERVAAVNRNVAALLAELERLERACDCMPDDAPTVEREALAGDLAGVVRRLTAQAWLRQGLALWTGERHESPGEAASLYSLALQADSAVPLAYLQRGRTFAEQDRYNRAVRDYNAAIRLEPGNAAAYVARGNAFFRQQRYWPAIFDYDRAVELDPDSSRALNNRGLLFTYMGDLESAIADYDRAIGLAPEDAVTYYNRGNAYLDQQRYALAAADFSRALERDPAKVEAYNNRGMAYHGLERYAAAVADFERVLELAPGHARAYANRGRTRFAQGRINAACSDFRRACELGLDAVCTWQQSRECARRVD